jgi:hypothetical protein
MNSQDLYAMPALISVFVHHQPHSVFVLTNHQNDGSSQSIGRAHNMHLLLNQLDRWMHPAGFASAYQISPYLPKEKPHKMLL